MGLVERVKGLMGSGKSDADDGAKDGAEVDAGREEQELAAQATEPDEASAWLDVRIESPAREAVTCPIHFDRAVSPGGTSLFETPQEAQAWPAVRALLGIPGVHSIIGKGDVLVVARRGGTDWPEILAAVEPALRAAFDSKGTVNVAAPPLDPLPSAPARPGTGSEDSEAEAELRGRVETIIEQQINPAVAAHGGYIDLLDVQGSRIFIHMGGGCQGCSMSAATLKQGVETTLRAEIPEISEILDTTDHAAGANPYFQA